MRTKIKLLTDIIFKNFFKIYVIIITVILVFNLLHCRKTSFYGEDLSGEGDDVYEINDKQDIRLTTTASGKHLSGIYVDGYLNELGLFFDDEKLIMSVLDAETSELLSESFVYLKNQPPKIDQSGTYFSIDSSSIEKGRKICLWLHSEGLSNRGVFYELSDTSLIDNETLLDGKSNGQTLCASLYYRQWSLDLLTPFLLFLLQAAAGYFLLLLHKKYGIPIRNPRMRANKLRPVKLSPGEIRSLLIKGFICIVLMAVAAEFAYNISVKRISGRYDGEVLCIDDYNMKTREPVKEDTVIEQVFRTDSDDLCGIGLKIQNNDDKEDEADSKAFYTSAKEKERLKDVANIAKNVEGFLHIQLYDNRTDELLVDKQYEVGYLKSFNSVMIPDLKSIALASMKDKFVYLDFGKSIENSSEGEYRLRVTGSETGDTGIRLSLSNRTNGTMMIDGKEKKSSLVLAVAFNNNGPVAGWYVMIAVMMISALVLIGILTKCFSLREETVFLLVILCMGVLFSLVIPPYCVPDERTHVDTIYKMSNGMLGIEQSPGPGRIYRRHCDIDVSISNTMSLSSYMYRDFHNHLFGAADADRELTISYARNALENVVSLNYLPGVFGFTIARLLGRNLMTAVMMARWFTLTAAALLMYAAVRKAPFCKAVFAIIGLLPKMINQLVSCSYDSMLIGAVFVFAAYSMYLIYEESVSITDLTVVLFSAWFIASNKGGVYFPLVLILVLLPFVRRDNRKINWRLTLGMIGSSFCMILLKFVPRFLQLFTNVSGTAKRTEGGQILYTISDFIKDPGAFIRIYENTLVLKSQSLFGDMFGITMGQRTINAHWLIIIAFILLLLLSVLAREDERVYFTGFHRVVIVLITVMGAGMIGLSMLLAWTENGSDTIQGMQGRYFLPYLIFPVQMLRNTKIIKTDDLHNESLIWSGGILLYITFINLITAAFYCSEILL